MFGGGGIPCGGVYVGLIGDRGVTLTCYHVAQSGIISAGGSPQLEVTNDKYGYDLSAVFTQPLSVPPITLGNAPPSGERLTITGFPRGRFGSHSGPMGGRAAPQSGQQWGDIIVGVASQGGDSGGAVTNTRGQLVGILWGTASNGSARSMVTPIEAIKDFLQRLRSRCQLRGGNGQNPIVENPRNETEQPWNQVEEIPPPALPPIEEIVVEKDDKAVQQLNDKIGELTREIEELKELCGDCGEKVDLLSVNKKIEGNTKSIEKLIFAASSLKDWQPEIDANRKAIEELAGKCYPSKELADKITANSKAIQLLLDTPIRLQTVVFDPEESNAVDILKIMQDAKPGEVIQETTGTLGGVPLRLQLVPVRREGKK